MAIGFIIALVFLYYLFTNPTFVSFVTSALNFGTAAVQSGAIGQLVNATRGMNESAFLSWAGNSSNSNPVIGQIKSTSSDNATLNSNLKTVWAGIENARNSQTFNSLTALINGVLSGVTGKP